MIFRGAAPAAQCQGHACCMACVAATVPQALLAALDIIASPSKRSALAAAAPAPRVYLSPATLVVVPSTLIEHWRAQIRVRVRQQARKCARTPSRVSCSLCSLGWCLR